MIMRPRPGTTIVHHEHARHHHAWIPRPGAEAPHQNGRREPTRADGKLFDPATPPRRFALCLAHPDGTAGDESAAVSGETEPADPATPGANHTEQEPHTLDSALLWGLAYPEETLVYVRDPYTDTREASTFPTPEDARAHYSRYGLLRLVYC